MGVQISAYVRSRLGSSTLEGLLSDDKFVEKLAQNFVGLDNKAQQNLTKLLNRCKTSNSSEGKDSNSETTRLRPLWEIQPEDVAIPSEIEKDFEGWKLDHLAFLQRESSSELRIPSSPGEHYQYTRSVQASLASNRILWRFLTTVYYDIVSEHSQSSRNSRTKAGVEFVAAVICNSVPHDKEIVKETVSSWVKEGGKFRGLADAMGGLGCYFFLPVKLSEWIWIKYLTQAQRESAIKLLRGHGIVEKARDQGAQSLAKKIERSLRAPFEECTSLTVQVRQHTYPAMAYAQGVNALSGDTDMHESEQLILGDNQEEHNNSQNDVEEVEVMDVDRISCSRTFDSVSGASPTAIPKLTTNSLIKRQWPTSVRIPCVENLEQELFGFYVHCICAGRTVLKDNAYFNEFLPILQSNGRTINPVLALSASYLKEYFDEGSLIRGQIEYAEQRYTMETAKEVREALTRGDIGAPTAVAAALLSHHATLNPSFHACCWTKYLYPMLDPAGAEVEANLAMASVGILAMTALPLNGKRNFQSFNYDWIGYGEEKQLTRVNSTLGLSRMMLYFIHSITQEAKDFDKCNADRLLRKIEESPQWVNETEGDMPRYIALTTAETYRLGTQLYCFARLYGYTPEHPDVKRTCCSLLHWLHKLPMEGPWYSSIHPAWCFVIACISVQAEEEYRVLVNSLDRIAGDNKSNVEDVCSLVRRTRDWQCQEWGNRDVQDRDPGWWERMTEYVDGGFVICLA
ncbi:hypothetical protein DM02DRAFT_609645 [Periconia macrospinosa]|uniref:Uncharacterized protein n=1 Tax=Periconia macrospinosa TaxID=97972 RepID=A0A2V1E770_9PLEO|nr:hypothetical protein DM02DRAFT_609645 [Periconia macrospinosa]